MAISVIMPALEMAQETGKLLSWRKNEGDHVVKGEPLLDVETDKAVVEIASPADGVLAGVKAQPGASVPVGQVIAWLLQNGESVPSGTAAARALQGEKNESSRFAQSDKTVAVPDGAGGISPRMSPKARRLAREQGIDVSKLQGSGTGGEILAEDVLKLTDSVGGPFQTPSSAPAPENPDGPIITTTSAPTAGLETMGSIGRLMAERTTLSWTTVPHFFVTREVDAGGLIEAREQIGTSFEKEGGAKPTYTDLLVALVARVLVKHPRMNASWTTGGIRLHSAVNVGVAVAVNDGVVVTVIRNAHTIGLDAIATTRRDLSERARSGRLQPSDISDPTFTMSNLGMHGVDSFAAVIVAPQAAILAVARIADRVVPVDGRPGIRPMLTLTLSGDHRVVDGAQAARFLGDVAAAIGDAAKSLS